MVRPALAASMTLAVCLFMPGWLSLDAGVKYRGIFLQTEVYTSFSVYFWKGAA